MKLQELINALQKAEEKVGNVDVMINRSWDDDEESIDDVILKGSYSLTREKDDDVKVLILI